MPIEHETTKLIETGNITSENISNSSKIPKTLYVPELLYALNLLLMDILQIYLAISHYPDSYSLHFSLTNKIIHIYTSTLEK